MMGALGMEGGREGVAVVSMVGQRERGKEIEREDGGKAGHGHCTIGWSKIIPACLNFPP